MLEAKSHVFFYVLQIIIDGYRAKHWIKKLEKA